MGTILKLGLFCGSVLWSLCWAAPALALGESSARAVGMGGTYVAVARNLDAVGWNPANLGLLSDRKVSIALFSLGVGAGNSAFSLGDYNKYNGKVWSEADKQDILGKVPAEGVIFNTTAEVRALGVSYGRYALRVNVFGAARGRLQKDPVELVLFGNEPDRVYRVDDSDGKGQGIWNLSFSGAYPLQTDAFDEFALGMTLRLMNGIGFLEVLNAKGTLTTQERGMKLEGDGRVKRAEGGSGFSVDLGAAAVLNRRWSAGVSLVHLGSMSWDKEAFENTGTMGADSLKVTDIIDVETFDDLFNPVDQERALSSFSTSLPTTLRLGLSRQTDRSLLALDWEQGLNSSPGSTTRPRISVGGEVLAASWLPVRAGLSLGGRNRTTFTFGFGLGRRRISFDWALRIRKGVIPNAASGVGMATELKLGF